MLGLYIHIPFCNSICSYCDFTKRLGNNNLYSEYMDKLIEEIDAYKNYLDKVDTVFIGGGTPNVIPLELLEKLFIKIAPALNHSIESTIELNPELITDDLCKLLYKYKFNRISIGVETINDNSIKLLNRHHTKNDIIQAFNLLRNNNLTNINCDLIFGIPYTTINDVKNDLEFILSLKPTHISYYDLIIENKTILKHKIDIGEIEVLDEDLEADMYDYINEKLEDNNYHHYEISNYAKDGFESMHNMIYWNVDNYIGVGMGASGYLNDIRYDNNTNINAYFKAFTKNTSKISIEMKKKEFMMLGLRLVDGISTTRYKNLFNSDPFSDFDLEKLIKKGLIEVKDDYIRIPKDKLFIANIIWSEFL